HVPGEADCATDVRCEGVRVDDAGVRVTQGAVSEASGVHFECVLRNGVRVRTTHDNPGGRATEAHVIARVQLHHVDVGGTSGVTGHDQAVVRDTHGSRAEGGRHQNSVGI